jgi:hypothetical protein
MEKLPTVATGATRLSSPLSDLTTTEIAAFTAVALLLVVTLVLLRR